MTLNDDTIKQLFFSCEKSHGSIYADEVDIIQFATKVSNYVRAEVAKEEHCRCVEIVRTMNREVSAALATQRPQKPVVVEKTPIAYEPKTHARSSDPSTSQEAAESIQNLVKRLIDVIHANLKQNGSGTYEEIARRCELRNDQVWRRLSDMETMGLAKPTDRIRPGSSGKMQRVWEAA